MSTSDRQGAGSGEVTLVDVARLFKQAWKSMLVGGVAGGLLVGAYVGMVPHKYGATAIVRMAQVPTASPSGSYVRANVEAPEVLVEKLRTPSMYTGEVAKACGVEGQRVPGERLVERLTVSPRNPENVVSFTVRAESAAVAGACANAVFDMIRKLQAADSKPTVDRWSRTLQDLQSRMADSRAYLASLEKGGVNQVAYLAQRDEVAYLGRRIDEVRTTLDLQADARLLVPVHTPSEPVSPRRPVLLIIIGAVAGMLAGFLIAGLRRFS